MPKESLIFDINASPKGDGLVINATAVDDDGDSKSAAIILKGTIGTAISKFLLNLNKGD